MARWQFSPAIILEGHNTIGIYLRDSRLNDRWAVHGIEPNEVADLHDAMTVHHLWNEIGLSDSLGPPTASVYLSRCTVGKDLVRLMECDPVQVKERYLSRETLPDRIDRRLARIMEYWDMLARARFAMRVLDNPDLTSRLVNAEFNYTPDQVFTKITDVASSLGIQLDKHFSKSLPG
jgi:hypothetical protein